MADQEQLYNEFADLAALELQKKEVLAIFAEIKTGIKGLTDVGVGMDKSSGLRSMNEATRSFIKSQHELDAITKRVEERKAQWNGTSKEITQLILLEAKASKEASTAKLQEAKARLINAQAADKEAGSVAKTNRAGKPGSTPNSVISTDNLAELQKEKEALKQTGTVVNDLDRAQAAAANSATQLKVSQSALSSTVKAGKIDDEAKVKAIKDLKFANSEANVELQGFKIQKLEANKAAKLEALENLGLIDSYTKLSNEYKIAAQNAKNLAVQYGVNSPVAKAAAKEALGLNTQLQAIDKTVGQSNKNVGNYGSAFKGIFGSIRQLANILPGIGIAGIFGAVFSGIASLFSNTSKKADELKEKIKGLIKPIEDIQSAATAGTGESISKVTALSNAVLDQTLSYHKRNEALNQLKEINKNYFGDLTLETAALGGLKKAVDEYTNAIIAAAVVKGFESEIGKVSVELNKQLTDYNKAGKAVDDYGRALDDLNKKIISEGRGGDAKTDSDIENISRAELKLRKAKDNLTLIGSGASQLSSQMTNLKSAIQGAVNESLKFKPLTSQSTGSKTNPAIENERKAALELFKFKQQLLIDEQKQIANSPLPDDIRIQARKKQAQLEMELIIGVANFELEKAKLTQSEKALIDAKETEDLKNTVQARNRDIFIIQYQAQQELRQLGEETSKYLEQLEKDRLEKERVERFEFLESVNRQQISLAQTIGDKELTKLNELYSKGLIDKETYERRKTKIERDTLNDSLLIQVDYYEKLLAISTVVGEARINAEKELARIRKEISAQGKTDADNDKAKDLEDIAKIQKAWNDLASVIGSALDAASTAQKNKIQEQIDDLDKKKEKEIAAINASSDTEEKKAAKIKLLEANVQAQREALQRRQREIDRKKAIFDKANTITNIILNTATAVTKALPDLFLAILAGAMGAAQLAIAVAAPIPTFAKGTNNAPGGISLVSEEGRELRIEKSGRVSLTPDTPTLMSLTKGDKILPHKVTEDILASISMTKLAAMNGVRVKESDNRDLLESQIAQLKALNKKQFQFIIHNEPGVESSAWYQYHLKR